MKCSNCGFENANDSIFCENCGAPLIKPVTYETDPYGTNSYQNDQYNENYENDQYDSSYQNDQYNENYGNDQYDRYGDNGYDDDREWEEQRRIRAENRKAYRVAQQKAENRRIIIIGIIIAAVIAVAGIAAFFGINYFMKNENSGQNDKETAQIINGPVKEGDNENNNEETVLPTPTMTPAATPQPTVTPTPPVITETPTPTPTPEPIPTEVPLTAQIKTAAQVDRSGYSLVSIRNAAASSTLEQEGYDNSPSVTYDGKAETSWQEGAEGDGLGEFITYKLSREYQVKCITFKMGNWRDKDLFASNNRPRDISVWVGDVYFSVTVPDGMTEYCLEFSKEIPADEVIIQIDSIYKGTEWDDTCISEVGIYGR